VGCQSGNPGQSQAGDGKSGNDPYYRMERKAVNSDKEEKEEEGQFWPF